jgi:hypothetical protein
MNSVDIANQLRATVIIYFSRNEKEFFPGMFWAIDIILTNYWKIYESLYSPFLSSTQKRRPGVHREFLEALVELLFLCDSKTYTEIVPGISFKEYPKYDYSPYKPGRKSAKDISLNFIDLSQKTPFIFKGDPGRPRVSILVKITPISYYHHIKIITRGRCLVYRNSKEIIAREENIVYKTVFKILGEILEEIKSLKEPKRIQDKTILWKCNKYTVPICRPGESY